MRQGFARDEMIRDRILLACIRFEMYVACVAAQSNGLKCSWAGERAGDEAPRGGSSCGSSAGRGASSGRVPVGVDVPAACSLDCEN